MRTAVSPPTPSAEVPPPVSAVAPLPSASRTEFLRDRLRDARVAAGVPPKADPPVESSGRQPSFSAQLRPHSLLSSRHVSRVGTNPPLGSLRDEPAIVSGRSAQPITTLATIPASPPNPVSGAAPAGTRRPRAVEICAGSAGLTRALCRRGFDAFGVDWTRNRHAVLASVINF